MDNSFIFWKLGFICDRYVTIQNSFQNHLNNILHIGNFIYIWNCVKFEVKYNKDN